MSKFNRNTLKNGLEIWFERIPDESVRTELKVNGFKWHSVSKFWYAKETPDRLALVQRLCNLGTYSTVSNETNVNISTSIKKNPIKKYTRKNF